MSTPLPSTSMRRPSTSSAGSLDPSLDPRSMPAAARERPSPIRLVPIVRSAIASTGSTTPHGCTVRPCRFSLIIRPQSAAGGCRPKPRKLRPAMSPIEYVSRRLASTVQRARHVRQDLAEEDLRPRLADRLGGAHEVALDDLERRAARDARHPRRRREADREDEQPELRADGRDGDEREDDRREGEDHVHPAHEDVVEDRARVGGDEPDRDRRARARSPSPRSRGRGSSGRPRGSG